MHALPCALSFHGLISSSIAPWRREVACSTVLDGTAEIGAGGARAVSMAGAAKNNCSTTKRRCQRREWESCRHPSAGANANTIQIQNILSTDSASSESANPPTADTRPSPDRIASFKNSAAESISSIAVCRSSDAPAALDVSPASAADAAGAMPAAGTCSSAGGHGTFRPRRTCHAARGANETPLRHTNNVRQRVTGPQSASVDPMLPDRLARVKCQSAPERAAARVHWYLRARDHKKDEKSDSGEPRGGSDGPLHWSPPTSLSRLVDVNGAYAVFSRGSAHSLRTGHGDGCGVCCPTRMHMRRKCWLAPTPIIALGG